MFLHTICTMARGGTGVWLILPTSPALISWQPRPIGEYQTTASSACSAQHSRTAHAAVTQFAHRVGRSTVLQITFESSETWCERQCQRTRQTAQQRAAFAPVGRTAGKHTSGKGGTRESAVSKEAGCGLMPRAKNTASEEFLAQCRANLCRFQRQISNSSSI